MALSRAAAAAARKAAKSRGLKGNRAEDGSLKTFNEEKFITDSREHVLKELGGDEKGRLPDPNEKFADIDESNPNAVQKELVAMREDIVYWEDGLESLTDDYEILLVQTRLRRLRNREAELEDILDNLSDARVEQALADNDMNAMEFERYVDFEDV